MARLLSTTVWSMMALIVTCWNSQGHMIVTRIAELYLNSTQPIVLRRAAKNLRTLGRFFKETPNSLLEASVMPDFLNYENNGFLMYYHYSDFPHFYKNDDDDPIPGAMFPFGIEYAYQSAINIIIDSQDAEKQQNATVKAGLMDSLMLRFILHLTGDAHQPLHAASLFSETFLNQTLKGGDMGGNLIPVDDIFQRNITNLHSLWDSCLGLYEEMKEMPLSEDNKTIVTERAEELMKRYPRSSFENEVMDIDMGNWVKESFEYVTSFVYSDIDIFPILSPQYIYNGRQICTMRMALAGYRLAQVLSILYEPRPGL